MVCYPALNPHPSADSSQTGAAGRSMGANLNSALRAPDGGRARLREWEKDDNWWKDPRMVRRKEVDDEVRVISTKCVKAMESRGLDPRTLDKLSREYDRLFEERAAAVGLSSFFCMRVGLT